LATKKKSYHAWNNYKIAACLKDAENPIANTVTLSTCIRSDALDVYEGLKFKNEDAKKDIN